MKPLKYYDRKEKVFKMTTTPPKVENETFGQKLVRETLEQIADDQKKGIIVFREQSMFGNKTASLEW